MWGKARAAWALRLPPSTLSFWVQFQSALNPPPTCRASTGHQQTLPVLQAAWPPLEECDHVMNPMVYSPGSRGPLFGDPSINPMWHLSSWCHLEGDLYLLLMLTLSQPVWGNPVALVQITVSCFANDTGSPSSTATTAFLDSNAGPRHGCVSFPWPPCPAHTTKTTMKILLARKPVGIQVLTKVDWFLNYHTITLLCKWMNTKWQGAGPRTRWPDLALLCPLHLEEPQKALHLSRTQSSFEQQEGLSGHRSPSQVWSPKIVVIMPQVIQTCICFSNICSFCRHLWWRHYISFKLWHVASIFQPEYTLTEGKNTYRGQGNNWDSQWPRLYRITGNSSMQFSPAIWILNILAAAWKSSTEKSKIP